LKTFGFLQEFKEVRDKFSEVRKLVDRGMTPRLGKQESSILADIVGRHHPSAQVHFDNKTLLDQITARAQRLRKNERGLKIKSSRLDALIKQLDSGRKFPDDVQAEYDDLNLSRGLSDERMKKYFIRHDKKIRVSDKVKSRVRFFELNLLNSFTLLGKFDLVFCRNVLIYFSNENKSEILARIGSVMKPNAWLFLGASESIANYSDAFDMINCPRGVVYQKKS